jgi:hypothetical protein
MEKDTKMIICNNIPFKNQKETLEVLNRNMEDTKIQIKNIQMIIMMFEIKK